MWTNFVILSTANCRKFNLLSFDIRVIIENSWKVKSYTQFSKSSRYFLNAFSCFRIKFSKYSYSMQMTLVQVIYYTVLIQNINAKVIDLQYVCHPSLQTACESVSKRADPSIKSFGVK